MRHRIFKNNKTAIKNQTANKVNIFSDKKGLIVSFFSIIPITVLYKIIDVYNNLTYQLKCGDFYKLPTQYFILRMLQISLLPVQIQHNSQSLQLQ